MNDQPQWIFTFGFGHTHPDTGEPLRNCYVVIEGDINTTRRRMCERFGFKWAMQYRNKDEAGVDRYKLKEIPL